MLFHSWIKAFSRSLRLCTFPLARTFLPRESQICSIRFISGDTAGQGSTLMLFLFRNCRHILATWGPALSYINIAGPCLWRKGTASGCRIWLMWPWALRLSCTTMIFVFLLPIMPPHTITLPPPNRSLSMRQLSAKRSPLLLKTRIRPSW